MITHTQIAEAVRAVEALPADLPWRESVLQQLNYCQRVLAGDEGGERLERLNMGLVAAREMEGFDGELANKIMEIQYQHESSRV